MIYVQRDQAGAVAGVYAQPQPGYAEEALAEDHPDVLAYRAPKPAEVKLRARAVILARSPDWKQQNMTARGVELLHRGPASWDAAEAAEAAALQAAWDWIKAVRARSDQLEAAIAAGAAADLESGTVDGAGGWP